MSDLASEIKKITEDALNDILKDLPDDLHIATSDILPAYIQAKSAGHDDLAVELEDRMKLIGERHRIRLVQKGTNVVSAILKAVGAAAAAGLANVHIDLGDDE